LPRDLRRARRQPAEQHAGTSERAAYCWPSQNRAATSPLGDAGVNVPTWTP
jgi:hypothetical protein